MRIPGEQTHPDGEKAGGERADDGDELESRSNASEDEREARSGGQEHRRRDTRTSRETGGGARERIRPKR